MIVLRPPAELAATVRRVADRLPLHLHAEARDLHQAADVLDGSIPLTINADTHPAVLCARIRELGTALAKEKGGWDAFYKLRKSVGEARYPGMTAAVGVENNPTAANRAGEPSA